MSSKFARSLNKLNKTDHCGLIDWYQMIKFDTRRDSFNSRVKSETRRDLYKPFLSHPLVFLSYSQQPEKLAVSVAHVILYTQFVSRDRNALV